MKTTTRANWLIALTGCSVMLTLLGGCHFSPKKTPGLQSLFAKDETPILPDRMMVIWTDTVLHQPQQPGVRGFGGRAYFYHGKNSDPIEVDGGLAVYAFDANNMHVDQTKPERKFVFTADQLSEHLSHTDMGPSYSIWLPWDQVGGVSRQLSLVTRFEGRNGGVVISEPTIKLLPGTKPKEPQAEVAGQPPHALDDSYVRTANHLEPLENSRGETKLRRRETTNPSAQRRTETIDLPPSFYRHLIPPNPALDQTPDQSPSSTTQAPAKGDLSIMESTSGTRATVQPNQPETGEQVHSSAQPGFQPRYSFRSTGTDERAEATSTNRTRPLPAGWIRELPRTPRR